MIVPGSIIADRYSIVRLVGEGGMGSVYEAQHVLIGKRVAVKLLSRDFMGDQEAFERFQREAQIAGSMGHVNICEVTDFGVTGDGVPFIVMEYLDGTSLADLIKLHGRIPPESALRIMKQVLTGLEEAHSRGVVHRDLKPENIFLTKAKGIGEVVKVLDFGISKIIRRGPDSMRLTKTGAMVGTPYYMSPEQARGRRDLDHRTDIYSCGVILYEMITGRVPFGGDSFNEIIFRIVEDPFPDPGELAPGLHPRIVKLLRRATERDQDRRIQGAAQLTQEISAVLDEITGGKGAGVQTKMASAVYQGRGEHGRGKGKKAVLVVALLLVIGGALAGAGLLISSIGREEPAAAPAAPRAAVKVPAPAVPAETGPAAKAGAEEKAPPPLPPVEVVRVEVTGAPQGAHILFAGQDIAGSVLEVEKGDGKIAFTVAADGYASRELTVVPSKDVRVDGRLTRSGAAAAKPKAQPAPVAKEPAPPQPVAKEPAAGTKKPGKKKMDPSWDYDK